MACPTQQYVRKIPTFVALPPPQIYYALLLQVVQTPSLAPPTPLGQVFAQQNRPNQPTPNNQQGQDRNNRPWNQGNNQPQGGSQQPNPPNNVVANRPTQNLPRPNAPRCNSSLRTNQPCTLYEVYGHYTFECPLMGCAKQPIRNEAQQDTNTMNQAQPKLAT